MLCTHTNPMGCFSREPWQIQALWAHKEACLLTHHTRTHARTHTCTHTHAHTPRTHACARVSSFHPSSADPLGHSWGTGMTHGLSSLPRLRSHCHLVTWSRRHSCWKDTQEAPHLCASSPVNPGPRTHPAAAQSCPRRCWVCRRHPRPAGGLGLLTHQTVWACKPWTGPVREEQLQLDVQRDLSVALYSQGLQRGTAGCSKTSSSSRETSAEASGFRLQVVQGLLQVRPSRRTPSRETVPVEKDQSAAVRGCVVSPQGSYVDAPSPRTSGWHHVETGLCAGHGRSTLLRTHPHVTP